MLGLDLANQVVNPAAREDLDRRIEEEAARMAAEEGEKPVAVPAAPAVRSSRVRADVPPSPAPDFERHEVSVPDLRAIWPYVNPHMLYGKHLGVKGAVDRLQEARDPKFLEIQELVRGLQRRCEQDGWMKARGLYRFFKAVSEGNRLVLLDGAGRDLERFEFPRQPVADGLCLSDFVRPAGGDPDTVAMFVATTGEGIRARAEALKAEGKYLFSHALQSLAIEAAEGFAEKLHRDLRTMWGFPDPPDLTMTDRFKAKYRGIRVSFGYPACPDLSDQEKLFRLLDPGTIGVKLTEGHMMDPEASVSALVFAHPQAEYFSAGSAG
jgi:5-methyltetrahydrofolate--homocysteine methyltransferase